jgi:hypothetical protein
VLSVACARLGAARAGRRPVGSRSATGCAPRLPLTDVEGVDVPRRGPLRLLRRGERPLRMTALSRRDLPRLLAVAQPDQEPAA